MIIFTNFYLKSMIIFVNFPCENAHRTIYSTVFSNYLIKFCTKSYIIWLKVY